MNIRSNACALVVLVSVGIFQQSVAPMQRNNNNNNNAMVAQNNELVGKLNNVFNNSNVKTLLSAANLYLSNNDRTIKRMLVELIGDENENKEFIDQACNLLKTITNPNNSAKDRLDSVFFILSMAHGYKILEAANLAFFLPTIASLCGVKLSELTKDIQEEVMQTNDCPLGMFYLAAASLSKDFNYYITGMSEEKVDMFLSVCTEGTGRLTNGTTDFINRLTTNSHNFERLLNDNIETIEDRFLEL